MIVLFAFLYFRIFCPFNFHQNEELRANLTAELRAFRQEKDETTLRESDIISKLRGANVYKCNKYYI